MNPQMRCIRKTCGYEWTARFDRVPVECTRCHGYRLEQFKSGAWARVRWSDTDKS